MHLQGIPTLLTFPNNMFGVDGLVILIIGLLVFGRRLKAIGSDLKRTARGFYLLADFLDHLVVLAIFLLICVIFYEITRNP